MSHSSSSSTTNIIVFNQCMNSIGKTIGCGDLHPEAPVDNAAKLFQKAFMAKLPAEWAKVFPNTPLPPGQTDFGFMGPWDANQPGKAPKCVVDQITQDLTNWQMPIGTTAATQLAQTITQQVYNHEGEASFNSGKTQIGANFNLDWVVLSGQVPISGSGDNTVMGICYLFAAALSAD